MAVVANADFCMRARYILNPSSGRASKDKRWCYKRIICSARPPFRSQSFFFFFPYYIIRQRHLTLSKYLRYDTQKIVDDIQMDL